MNFEYEIRNKLVIINEHMFQQYLVLVLQAPVRGCYSEEHHILPKAIWPQYKNKSTYPENIVRLTLRDHLLAHYYFSKATNALWNAIPAIAYATSNGARLLQDYDLDIIEMAMREYKENCVGTNHPRYGSTHTQETKNKISKALTGNTWTAERKEEHSHKMKGRKKPDGFGEQISKARTGTTHTESTKAKISKAHTGKVLSSETKAKISKARRGMPGTPHTEESKHHLSTIRKGDGNPMYGRNQSEVTKQKMKDKKRINRMEVWGDLYNELFVLWVKANRVSAYKFAKWLSINTNHTFTSSKLNALITDYKDIN